MSKDQRDDMDLGLRRSMILRHLRRWLVLLVLLGLFVEEKGLPHVRLTNPFRETRRTVRVEYWSVTGKRHYGAHRAPLVVLIPLERSLLDYASDAAEKLWRRAYALATEAVDRA